MAGGGCYRNSLQLAADHGLKSIAFPAISTGVYRFPVERACRIALQTTLAFLAGDQPLDRVVFTCFSESDLSVYRKTYAELKLS